MTVNLLPELLEQFRYCRLKVTVRLERDCELPAHKGSMLHGWFGQALRRFDESAYQVFFGTHDNQQPKPYVVVIPPDYRTRYVANELFEFSLIIMGQACDLLPRVLHVLEQGQTLGLGPNHTPFSLLSISSELPCGSVLGIAESSVSAYVGQRLAALASTAQGLDDQQLAIQLMTPLRVKYQNRQLTDSLKSVGFIGIQVARRITQLARFWVNDDEALLARIMAEQPYYRELEYSEHLYVEKWHRFSLREQKKLPFGGLKGQVSAVGEFTALLPLLYAGECLHVGGKTTFGSGEIKVIAAC